MTNSLLLLKGYSARKDCTSGLLAMRQRALSQSQIQEPIWSTKEDSV